MRINPADIGFRILAAVGVPAPLALRLAPLGIAIALLALLAASYGLLRAGWAVFDWWNDREAVEQATAEANVKALDRQLKAEREAGAGKETRDAAGRAGQQVLEGKLDDAKQDGSSGADAVWNGGLWTDPAD